MYASQSMTLAKLLHLDKPRFRSSSALAPQNSREQACLNEHRKQLWWTSYCMDRMVATELGVDPFQAAIPEGMQLPSTAHIAAEDIDQFFYTDILAAQAKLYDIKHKVATTVSRVLWTSNEEEILNALSPCLELLKQWWRDLPSHLQFEFDNGVPPMPYGRLTSSLYLRYHQVTHDSLPLVEAVC